MKKDGVTFANEKHKNYMYVIIITIIIFKCLFEFKVCIYLIME